MSVRRRPLDSRRSESIRGRGNMPRSVARRCTERRSSKWWYTQVHCRGAEHAGIGNNGASADKNRWPCRSAAAEQQAGPQTMLTACQGCL